MLVVAEAEAAFRIAPAEHHGTKSRSAQHQGPNTFGAKRAESGRCEHAGSRNGAISRQRTTLAHRFGRRRVRNSHRPSRWPALTVPWPRRRKGWTGADNVRECTPSSGPDVARPAHACSRTPPWHTPAPTTRPTITPALGHGYDLHRLEPRPSAAAGKVCHRGRDTGVRPGPGRPFGRGCALPRRGGCPDGRSGAARHRPDVSG